MMKSLRQVARIAAQAETKGTISPERALENMIQEVEVLPTR